MQTERITFQYTVAEALDIIHDALLCSDKLPDNVSAKLESESYSSIMKTYGHVYSVQIYKMSVGDYRCVEVDNYLVTVFSLHSRI